MATTFSTGATFVPMQTSDHAQEALAAMNTNLTAQGLENVTPNPASMIWQYLLAAGQLQFNYDQNLLQAINAFNISQCSDQQVLNCLPITGTGRISASYSKLNIYVTAKSSGNVFLPAGTIAAVDSEVSFELPVDVSIAASTSQQVEFVCTVPGPIQVSVGQITGFTTTIANLQSATNTQVAIPGTNEETIPQLRQRIIAGKTIMAGVDGARLAISKLPGVNQSSVYFNYSAVDNLPISGTSILVPPKKALIIVSGYSDYIAEKYYSYMNSQSYNAAGSTAQNYVTKSGQVLPVYFLPAGTQDIYVKVFVSALKPLQTGYEAQIKTQVVGLNDYSVIGQYIISEWVYSTALTNFTLATIVGVQVSLNGTDWSFAVQSNQISIPQYSSARVTVVSV